MKIFALLFYPEISLLEKAGDEVASGPITEIGLVDYLLYVQFTGMKLIDSAYVLLVDDGEKYVEFDGEKLNLISPCCDRYNLHLEPNKLDKLVENELN